MFNFQNLLSDAYHTFLVMLTILQVGIVRIFLIVFFGIETWEYMIRRDGLDTVDYA